MRRLITLSASYGAGGNVVGPELATRLGVPFVDRAIPVKVAEDLDVTFEEDVLDDGVRRRQSELHPARELVMIGPSRPHQGVFIRFETPAKAKWAQRRFAVRVGRVFGNGYPRYTT